MRFVSWSSLVLGAAYPLSLIYSKNRLKLAEILEKLVLQHTLSDGLISVL
jgi:hypothetical protein